LVAIQSSFETATAATAVEGFFFLAGASVEETTSPLTSSF
jgi:hypothetical protein